MAISRDGNLTLQIVQDLCIVGLCGKLQFENLSPVVGVELFQLLMELC